VLQAKNAELDNWFYGKRQNQAKSMRDGPMDGKHLLLSSGRTMLQQAHNMLPAVQWAT